MERIGAYDIESKRVETIADRYGVYEADVIEALFQALDDNKIEIAQYL